MKATTATPWDAWPNRQQIIDMYMSGESITAIRRVHGKDFYTIKRMLVELGYYEHQDRVQKPVVRMWNPRVRHKGDPVAPKVALKPVGVVETPCLNWRPMLKVDIRTGKVLVDRRDEVMRRMSERSGMFGRW